MMQRATKGSKRPVRATTILLVDDEKEWLTIMKKALDKEPYRVITADSAEHALTRLKGKTPDLILSDVRMPITNGFELFEAVRKNPGLKKVPFVFMSSIDDFDAKHTARNMGADDYVEKPFDVDNARHIISDLLGRFHL